MNRKGSAPIVLLIIIVLVLFGVGVWYYEGHKAPPATTTTPASAQTEGCTLLPYTGTTSLTQLPSYVSGDPDFRGGMVCKFIINPSLPVFTFNFAGQADNTLGDIEIMEGSSTDVIQTIPVSAYNPTTPAYAGIDPNAIAPATSQNVLVPVDANFDGYKDLPILNNCGATGNCSYDFYLYNSSTNQFVFNSFLSDLGTPTFDATKQQVVTNWNSSATDFETDTYQYANGKYTLIRQVISTTTPF